MERFVDHWGCLAIPHSEENTLQINVLRLYLEPNVVHDCLILVLELLVLITEIPLEDGMD